MPKPKRPTLVDLAKEAGCSPALASIVMRDAPGASEQTRRKVRAAASRIGYRPDRRAQNLRQSRSKRIGVLYTVDNPFHADLVAAFWRNARRTGYQMILGISSPDEGETEGAELMLGERCEALIILGSVSTESELLALDREIPLIIVGKEVSDRQIDTVRVDDAQAVGQAMRYLLSVGHSRIAHIDGGGSPGAAERAAAYVEAMREAGLEDSIRVIAGGWRYQDGHDAAKQILEDPQNLPTAIIAFDDLVAIGTMNELLRHGVGIPEEVSIVGFDDTAQLSSVVPLTTVSQDILTMARVTWDGAVERAENRAGPREPKLPGRLVTRLSVGPPRKLP